MNDAPISGVILAGGLGRRMGNVDKGLQLLADKPLVRWVIERLAPQVDELLINANRNAAHYANFGYPVIADEIAGFAGPLAGVHAALSRSAHPLLLTVPCDSPFLPTDLVARLRTAMLSSGADLATVRSGGRAQPVFSLFRRELLPQLTDFLATGGRKIDLWHGTLERVEVPFDDQVDAFRNINDAAELSELGRHHCRNFLHKTATSTE